MLSRFLCSKKKICVVFVGGNRNRLLGLARKIESELYETLPSPLPYKFSIRFDGGDYKGLKKFIDSSVKKDHKIVFIRFLNEHISSVEQDRVSAVLLGHEVLPVRDEDIYSTISIVAFVAGREY